MCMTNRALRALAAVLFIAVAGGCSSADATAAPATSTQPSHVQPSPTSSPSPSPSATVAGGVTVEWSQSEFASSGCPAAHATADPCFAGTAMGTLPRIGTVALHRTVYTTGPMDAKGCQDVISDGTLARSTGVLTFRATGTLCDALATYRITSSKGTGKLAGVTIAGTITNNAGAETWTVAVTRS
jgi:hypothetical protein